MKEKILFCNIAYMQYYDNRIQDKPINGGAYVSENNDALEKYNFQECDDGYYRGFVETKHHLGYKEGIKNNTYNQIKIERIEASAKKEESISGVTVVFCATPPRKPNVIVGWYKNATVYRYRPQYDDRYFNLQARITDAVLLPEEERTKVVPRANRKGYGFGQSNVWYADTENSGAYIKEVLDYINSGNYSSMIDEECIKEELYYAESGVAKKSITKSYERNPKARKACLQKMGTACMICGFDSGETYGEEFGGKIHVHHIVPIHQVNKEYKVDPEKDLIPVCPNCHMMLHTKINGKEVTIEELRSRVKK